MSDRSVPPARPPNHLAGQTSPYLLQHLHNPVDWYPWGAAALAKARNERKPIFLSIGYAACHWCHVMERESFEDDRVAELLNGHFVPIKVDREERPDLDEIYMNAVQLMTGQGGWPLSVFLTPGQQPFFGGTYFPPDDRHGRPGFASLLERVHEAWTSRRGELERAAGEMTEELVRVAAGPAPGTRGVGRGDISRAAAELAARFDARWGGFGDAPKFPPDASLALLLREHERSGERVPLAMVETTLERMALGGIYDHIGGGFARYSVDERWLVPHFEKMLYTQALLVPLYLDAWVITGRELFRRVAVETLDFVRREMTSAEGGCYSSIDADSEGEEGKYYVWSRAEVERALGPEDGRFYSALYDITPRGNFEGKSIPNLLGGSLAERAAALGMDEAQLVARLTPLAATLLAARERRVRPATDDKVLAAWNGLMLTAFARAHQVLGRAEDLAAARGAARFLAERLWQGGRLHVSYRDGRAQLAAYLDDHAFAARGMLDLYEAGFDPGDLDRAAELARAMLLRFADSEQGGFFFTADDHEPLLARSRSLQAGALPAGAAVAAEVLVRLSVHRADPELRRIAERALTAYEPIVSRQPSAFSSLLIAADLAEGPVQEVAIVGEAADTRTHELLAAVRRRFRPRLVVQVADAGQSLDGLALLAGKTARDGRPTAWVCRDYACRSPTGDPEEVARQLGG